VSSEGWFLIFALAVFRLSEIVSRDLILDSIRRYIARKAAEGSRVWTVLANWIYCPLCVGVWFSIPASFVYVSAFLHSMDFIKLVTIWLGLSGAQYMLSKISINLDNN